MATLFHICSLLGFVPIEALEGLSTQRVWHAHRNAEIETESSVRGGPALFKLLTSVDAKHHGASLSERWNVTWVGNNSVCTH